MHKRLFCAFAATAAWMASGCGGGDPCPTGGRGNLELTVSGLPDGVGAAITLTGPEGERTATGSASLENLESGKWAISAAPVAAPGGLVRRAYDAAAPVEVCVLRDDTSAAAVAYAEIPTSARLWMVAQSSVGRLVALAQELLGSTRTVNPTVGAYVRPELPGSSGGLTFDKRGNLWAADATGSVKRIPAAALASTGTAEADIVITGFERGVPGPTHLAFDDAGNLWVSVVVSRKVVRFRPDQLTASAGPPLRSRSPPAARPRARLRSTRRGTCGWALAGD